MSLTRIVWTGLVVAAMSASLLGADVREQFQDIFGSLVRKARDTPDKADDLSAAEVLLESADALADRPALRAKVYRESIRMALSTPDGIDLARRARRSWARADAEKADTAWFNLLKRIARTAPPSDRAAYADLLLAELVGQAERLIETDPARAQALLRQARPHARRSLRYDTDYIDALSARARDTTNQMAQIQRLREQLEANPDNAEAARTLVSKLLTYRDDPEAAAEVVEATGDAHTAEMLKAANARLDDLDAADAIHLGDFYADLAGRSGDIGEYNAVRRAIAAYERAASVDEGVLGVKAKITLDRLRQRLSVLEKTIRAGTEMTVDLLADSRVQRQRLKGQWQFSGGRAALTSRRRWGYMQLLVHPSSDYTLQIDYEMLDNGSVAVWLPIAERGTCLLIRDDYVSLAEIDDRYHNESLSPPAPIKQRHRCRIEVDQSDKTVEIAVHIDNHKRLTWRGPATSEFTPRRRLPLTDEAALGIGGYYVAVKFHHVAVTAERGTLDHAR